MRAERTKKVDRQQAGEGERNGEAAVSHWEHGPGAKKMGWLLRGFFLPKEGEKGRHA